MTQPEPQRLPAPAAPSSPTVAATPAASPDEDTPETPNGPRWTPAKMAAFLRALAATHSVSAAAASVGMSRQSAYKLRARTRGKAFFQAWDKAFHQSYANLPYAALERALNGIEVPVYYKGEKVDSYRRYDERLTVALLRMAGNPTTLVVGGPPGFEARQGELFAGLLESIEAGGVEAEAEPETRAIGDFSAESANLSPSAQERFSAELRRFRAGEGG